MTATPDPQSPTGMDAGPHAPDASVGSQATVIGCGTDAGRGAERRTERPGLGERALRYVAKSLVQVALCLILYVASAGPMYWPCYEAYFLNGSSYVAKLYLPLAILCQREPAFSRFMDWYVGLWIFPHAAPVAPPPRHRVGTPQSDGPPIDAAQAATPSPG